MNEFSAGSCISFGWETFKKRPWFFVIATIIVGVFSFRYNYQTGNMNMSFHASPGIVVLIVVLAIVVAAIEFLVAMGNTKLMLNAHDNVETASLWNLWTPRPFWRFVGAAILVTLITVVGFILLIIPGIIWSLRYMFVPYLVMDRGLRPMEALNESARITYGYKWQLLWLGILTLLVNLLGLVCLIIGLLVTIPVTSLAIVHAYRTLQGKASAPVA